MLSYFPYHRRSDRGRGEAGLHNSVYHTLYPDKDIVVKVIVICVYNMPVPMFIIVSYCW